MNAQAENFRAIMTEWPRQGGPKFWLGYHIGSEFYGETDARFEADGRYELWSTVTDDEERRQFSGKCDPNDVGDLISLIVREQLWDVHHVRTTQTEDDALVYLEASDGERHGRIELWVSEVTLVPPFERVQAAVLELVRKLSGNVILEIGR
jgi:hypothetical protein